MTVKRSGYKILALTDSGLHQPYESVYPLLRALCVHPEIARVSVADRHNPENCRLYRDRLKIEHLYAFDVSETYSFDTRRTQRTGKIALADYDSVWFLLDHPVSPEFLDYAGTLFSGKFLLNHPHGMIRTSSKAYLSEIQAQIPGLERFLPPMALCHCAQDVESFKQKHPDLVLKTLRGYGGMGVKRYKSGATDLKTPREAADFLHQEGGSCLAMAYLDHPAQSDKRTIIFDGNLIGALVRMPGNEGWLCNVTSGGDCAVDAPGAEDKALVALIDPYMRNCGIHLYGIDMLKNPEGTRLLSEINTLNIGGIGILETITGENLTGRCADIFVDLLLKFYRTGTDIAAQLKESEHNLSCRKTPQIH